MSSKAWLNAKKIGQTELLVATAEFDVATETDIFDIGDIDLSQAGIRVEVEYNGVTIEDGDWQVDPDDNTRIKTNEPVPVDDEINFKVFQK